ncbi:hypothetical protein FHG87_004004 [Trinorchestia longiramus]|nr:hypothetical protein FHG87_004004 [Trinorchestia longiramus]
MATTAYLGCSRTGDAAPETRGSSIQISIQHRAVIFSSSALQSVGRVPQSETKGDRLYDFNAKRILLSRDVVFNKSQFMSFEKEPSKEIDCVPWSFPQEEKHEDSEGELELRRSTRNRAAPDRFGEWVCFAQDQFDVSRAEIDLVCCPSNDMLADIFTKGLSAEKFCRLRRKLGVVFFEKHIQCEKEC